jgi:hypothetical protein
MTQEIDPRFFIPPFVTGIEYSKVEQPSSDTPVQDGAEPSVVVVEGPFQGDSDTPDTEAEASAPAETRLLPPDYMTIISQTSRVTPGGVVVDVVIDVEDVARVSQFEVRITK